MRLLPGSYGSRNGAASSKQWATDRRRSEDDRAAHTPASLQEAVTAPSPRAMARAIESDCCPFCGAGPYKNLGLHTHRAHGVSAAELRTMSGLKTVCSEGLSVGSRERLEGRPDRDEITQRGAQVANERGAQSIALKASMKLRMAMMEERDPVIIQRALAGDRLGDIAADLGITTATVQRSLKRLGVVPTLKQTNTERRERLESNRTTARSALVRRNAEERDRRLRRFAELGGDWRAVETLAAECGTSERTMRAYLRKAGTEVPDGRAVSPRRPKARPDLLGKPNMASRAVTAEQMEEVRRLSRETNLSQREIGERFGVSQSIVSRVLLGKYVRKPL